MGWSMDRGVVLSILKRPRKFSFLATQNAHFGAISGPSEYLLLDCNSLRPNPALHSVKKGPERRSGAFRSQTNPGHCNVLLCSVLSWYTSSGVLVYTAPSAFNMTRAKLCRHGRNDVVKVITDSDQTQLTTIR